MQRAWRACDKCKGNCWLVSWAGKQVYLCDRCHGVGQDRPPLQAPEPDGAGLDGLFPDGRQVALALALVVFILVGIAAAVFGQFLWRCT